MTTPLQKQSWEKLTRLSRHESLSSHWTTVLANRWYFVLVCLVTLFHWVAARTTPLLPSEQYYWNLSQTLQKAYFDLPPLVVWFTAFSTAVFGDAAFGIRFFAGLICFVVLLCLGRMVVRKWLLELLLYTPLVMFGGLFMSPTLFLIFFWTLYLIWLHGANRGLSSWDADPVTRVYHKSPIPIYSWCLGGVLLGLGILSHYQMLLAIPACLLLLSLKYRRQAWQVGFLVHLFVALIVALPLVWYNVENGFMPLLYHWGAVITSDGPSIARLFGFLGQQVLLVGALPCLFLPWVLFRPRGITIDPVLDTNYFFFVVPFALLTYKAFAGSISPVWGMVTYVAFWSLAQKVVDTSSFTGLMKMVVFASFAAPWVVTTLILVHSRAPLAFVDIQRDLISQNKAHSELIPKIASELREVSGSEKVFASTRDLTASLRFHKIDADQYPGLGTHSHFTQIAPQPCSFDTVVILTPETLPSNAVGCFGKLEILKSYALVVRGQLLKQFDLIKYSK